MSVPGRQDYWIQDLAAASENILLAATVLGLGSVWCGVYPGKEPRTQYDSLRVHMNRWMTP